MKRALVLILALLCIISLAGCRGKPRILLNDEYLQITQTGGKIDVYDVLGDNVYYFRIVHEKPSNRVLEPYTAIDTPTLRIEKQYKKIILYVKRSEEIYTLSISRIFPNISLKLGVNE